jgi:hydroxymethylpyrimidine pyrophosphatase-like HAD family hydrolase
MPLNISIDVDGTLLDENENINPVTCEKLRQLKSNGHRLQLWSTGGADYAHKTAVKHNLTNVFASYATKADVAFDDILESLGLLQPCK